MGIYGCFTLTFFLPLMGIGLPFSQNTTRFMVELMGMYGYFYLKNGFILPFSQCCTHKPHPPTYGRQKQFLPVKPI